MPSFLRGHEFLQASAPCLFGTALEAFQSQVGPLKFLGLLVVSCKVQLCLLDCTVVMCAAFLLSLIFNNLDWAYFQQTLFRKMSRIVSFVI